MPYKFLFKIDEETHFEANLHTHQCESVKEGHRCGRNVIIGYTYCFQHLMMKKKLRIKQSTLGDFQGLFCQDKLKPTDNNILFRAGDVITQYIGERLNRDELDQRYSDKTGPYAALLNDKGDTIDAALMRGVGSLSNHGNTAKNRNAMLEIRGQNVYLKATKNIRNGSEILCNYGTSYDMNEEGVEFMTKKR